MKQASIRGDLISNDYKWIYDWLDYDSTCPNDIQAVMDELEPGEELQILVNSPGGMVTVGQEIFSLLQKCDNSVAIVESQACSAASVAIMGAKKVIISPVGMLMIHNASVGYVSGDKNDMEQMMEALTEVDKAIASAYVYKTGLSEREVLKLMNRETWLTANRAIELGFADEKIESDQSQVQMVAAFEALRVTPEMIEQVKAEKVKKELEEKQAEIRRILENEHVRARSRDVFGGPAVQALCAVIRTGSVPLNYAAFSFVAKAGEAAPKLFTRIKHQK
jgi:ATP-dependent protease ClpP protease subunit